MKKMTQLTQDEYNKIKAAYLDTFIKHNENELRNSTDVESILAQFCADPRIDHNIPNFLSNEHSEEYHKSFNNPLGNGSVDNMLILIMLVAAETGLQANFSVSKLIQFNKIRSVYYFGDAEMEKSILQSILDNIIASGYDPAASIIQLTE